MNNKVRTWVSILAFNALNSTGGAQSIMLVKQCGRKEERKKYIYIDDSKIGELEVCHSLKNRWISLSHIYKWVCDVYNES